MGRELGTGGWVGSLMLLGQFPFCVLLRPDSPFPELHQTANSVLEGLVCVSFVPSSAPDRSNNSRITRERRWRPLLTWCPGQRKKLRHGEVVATQAVSGIARL